MTTTVDNPESAARAALAASVRDVLTGAGLPVPADAVSGDHGAQLEVDLGDDAAGGVFVTWRVGAAHVEDANRSLLDGGFDDTAARRAGVVAVAMRDAMIEILRFAGLDARPSDDVMRPLALRVGSTPLRATDVDTVGMPVIRQVGGSGATRGTAGERGSDG
jgi:hypothetical protein